MLWILIGTEKEVRRERAKLSARERKHGRAVEGVTMREGNGFQVTLVKAVEGENREATNGSDSSESTSTTK